MYRTKQIILHLFAQISFSRKKKKKQKEQTAKNIKHEQRKIRFPSKTSSIIRKKMMLHTISPQKP